MATAGTYMLESLRALHPLMAALGRAWRRLHRYYRTLRHDPAARDRAAAVSTFAFIFAFAVLSVDYVVTGGPDWNPDAEAAELPAAYTRVAVPPPPRLPHAAPPERPAVVEPAEVDYSLTTEDLLGGPGTDLASYWSSNTAAQGAPPSLSAADDKPVEIAAAASPPAGDAGKGKASAS